MARVVLQTISRVLGLLILGRWFMLCAHAHFAGWVRFKALMDWWFDEADPPHCERCFRDELRRLSRRSWF